MSIYLDHKHTSSVLGLEFMVVKFHEAVINLEVTMLFYTVRSTCNKRSHHNEMAAIGIVAHEYN